MARSRYSRTPATLWDSRLFEWGVVSLLLLTMGELFFRHYRDLQGQAELAAIQSELGALRTALVLDYLKHSVHNGTLGLDGKFRSPFVLLQTLPANYVGELSVAELSEVEPGSWLFDPACPCVGYKPQHTRWLQPQQVAAPVLWFKLGNLGGPTQLTALQRYSWQGQSIN